MENGRPVRTRRLTFLRKADVVYEEVRRQILDGELAAGALLNQEHFAASLGVSTTPLREALRRLEAEGFIRTNPHHKMIVAPHEREELLFLYEVRTELDPYAAFLAADRHTLDDRTAMLGALALLPGAPGDDVTTLNREFHSSIYRASHNPVLVDLLDSLWDRSDRYRRVITDTSADPATRAEHEELLLAILDRDGEGARHLMRGHLERSRNIIENALEVGSLASR